MMRTVTVRHFREPDEDQELLLSIKDFVVSPEDNVVYELRVRPDTYQFLSACGPVKRGRWDIIAAAHVSGAHNDPYWPRTLTSDGLVILTKDLLLIHCAWHTEMLTLQPLARMSLLADEYVRNAYMDAGAFGPIIGPNIGGCSVKSNPIFCTIVQSRRFFALVEILPSLLIWLEWQVITGHFKPFSPPPLASSLVETLLGEGAAPMLTASKPVAEEGPADPDFDDHSSLSDAASSASDKAEMEEIIKTCECQQEEHLEELHRLGAGHQPRLRCPLESIIPDLEISLLDAFLIDLAETRSDLDLFQTRRKRRRAESRLVDWLAQVRWLQEGFFEVQMECLFQAATQLYVPGSQRHGWVTALSLRKREAGLMMIVTSLLGNLPWDCHTLYRKPSPVTTLTPATPMESVIVEEARDPLWIISPSALFMKSFNGVWRRCTVIDSSLSHLSRKTALSPADAQLWDSMCDLMCGEAVDIRTRAGKSSGRFYSFYPCQEPASLGSHIVKLTDHTYLIESRNWRGFEGHPLLLIFDKKKGDHLIRIVGSERLELTLNNPGGVGIQIGNSFIDPNIVDDLASTVDSGFEGDANMQEMDSESLMTADDTENRVTDDVSFLEALTETPRGSAYKQTLLEQSPFYSAKRRVVKDLICPSMVEGKSVPQSIYMLSEDVDPQSRRKDLIMSRFHFRLPCEVIATHSTVEANAIWRVPAEMMALVSSGTRSTGRTFAVSLSPHNFGTELPSPSIVDRGSYTLALATLVDGEFGTEHLTHITAREIRIEGGSRLVIESLVEGAEEESLLAVEAHISGAFVAVRYAMSRIRVYHWKRGRLTRFEDCSGLALSLDRSGAMLVVKDLMATRPHLQCPELERAQAVCCYQVDEGMTLTRCWPILSSGSGYLRDLSMGIRGSVVGALREDVRKLCETRGTRENSAGITLPEILGVNWLMRSSKDYIFAILYLQHESPLVLWGNPDSPNISRIGEGVQSGSLIYRSQEQSGFRPQAYPLTSRTNPFNGPSWVAIPPGISRVPWLITLSETGIPCGWELQHQAIWGMPTGAVPFEVGDTELQLMCAFCNIDGSLTLTQVARNSVPLKSTLKVVNGCLVEDFQLVTDMGTREVTKFCLISNNQRMKICMLMREPLARQAVYDEFIAFADAEAAGKPREKLYVDGRPDVMKRIEMRNKIKAHQSKWAQTSGPLRGYEWRSILGLMTLGEPSLTTMRTIPGEVALDIATFNLNNYPVLCVGTLISHLHSLPPRGRMLARLVDGMEAKWNLTDFAAMNIAGAVSNISRFIPVPISGQPDVSGRTFVHYTAGSRLYVQEVNVENLSKVAISGGTFFEARGSICDVKIARNFFVIGTNEGVELAMFRVGPVKSHTHFANIKMSRVGATLSLKGVLSPALRCGVVVNADKMAIVASGICGDLSLCQLRYSKEPVGVEESRWGVKYRHDILHVLEAGNVTRVPIKKIVGFGAAPVHFGCFLLAADGEILWAEFGQSSGKGCPLNMLDGPLRSGWDEDKIKGSLMFEEK